MRRQVQGVLPLALLLFFMNSAVCYCFSFAGVGHHHGAGEGETEHPLPHDCDCLTVTQPSQAQPDAPHVPPVLVTTLDGLFCQGRCAPFVEGRPKIEVRPPGEHAPPAFALHCSLLC